MAPKEAKSKFDHHVTLNHLSRSPLTCFCIGKFESPVGISFRSLQLRGVLLWFFGDEEERCLAEDRAALCSERVVRADPAAAAAGRRGRPILPLAAGGQLLRDPRRRWEEPASQSLCLYSITSRVSVCQW